MQSEEHTSLSVKGGCECPNLQHVRGKDAPPAVDHPLARDHPPPDNVQLVGRVADLDDALLGGVRLRLQLHAEVDQEVLLAVAEVAQVSDPLDAGLRGHLRPEARAEHRQQAVPAPAPLAERFVVEVVPQAAAQVARQVVFLWEGWGGWSCGCAMR